LLKIRESRTYLVYAIGGSVSYPRFNYYAIVLQTIANILNIMLVESYFLRYINLKDVEENTKVK
jgi:hypothetical protein